MVETAFSAVEFPLAAEYRIETVLSQNPAQVHDDAPDALAFEQKPAGALSSVNGLKIGLGQSQSVYLMINNRLPQITDFDTGPADSLGELDVFRSPGSSGTEPDIELSYFVENLAAKCHIGAVQ